MIKKFDLLNANHLPENPDHTCFWMIPMGKDGYGQQAESGRKIKVVYCGVPGACRVSRITHHTMHTIHTPKSFILNRDANTLQRTPDFSGALDTLGRGAEAGISSCRHHSGERWRLVFLIPPATSPSGY